VLVRQFPAALFGTNCYVVAPSAGEECVIIDPGAGVVDRVEACLTELKLRPAAVLLTHGHFDHCFAVTPVCGAHDVPLVVHGDDRYRLKDPLGSLDAGLRFMLEQQFASSGPWAEPDDILTVEDAEQLSLAGLDIRVVHAPGHTEGSVIFRLPDRPDDTWQPSPATETAFTGDVLFAGSIGRTDLAGGDPAAMQRSLANKVLAMPDTTYLFPGHGETSNLGRERRVNPYLREVEHAGAEQSPDAH